MEKKDVMEVTAGNKLIAQFMQVSKAKAENGLWYYVNDNAYLQDELKYNISWSWLMPVWVKFRDLKFDDTRLQLEHSGIKAALTYQICYGTIEQVFIEMFTAIQWYNTTS